MDSTPWKWDILRQLRLRSERESGGFSELIVSHGKLQEQVENLCKEITRLEYRNNELEEQVGELEREGGGSTSGGGGGGAALTKANRKIEELNEKLREKMEDMMHLYQKNTKDSAELSKKDSKVTEQERTLKKLNARLKETDEQLKEKTSAHRELMDEHHTLQLTFTSIEEKLKESHHENDRLRVELMRFKSRQADKLNEENEVFRKKREKQLEDEIRRASEEKDVPSARTRTGSRDRKGSSASAGAEARIVEEAPGPSMCPATTICTIDAHDNEVSALCFSADGNYMATGGADKVVKVWSWVPLQEKMEPKCSLYGSNASIMSVEFDQVSKLVLAASNDYAARIWTFHDQRPKHTLTGHSNKVLAAKFLEDNQKVVTGSHDRTLKIWDLHHRTCSKTLFAGSSCNDVVAGRGMGNTVISGHFDKRIRFWDVRTGTANEIALQGKVTGLDLFPERHLLLCCSRDDTLRLIDLRQNSITATFTASGFHVSVDWTRACFSPDGQYVGAGSSDGTLFVWETLTGKVKSKREHSKEMVACAWHPQGQLFASGDRNKKVLLWKR